MMVRLFLTGLINTGPDLSVPLNSSILLLLYLSSASHLHNTALTLLLYCVSVNCIAIFTSASFSVRAKSLCTSSQRTCVFECVYTCFAIFVRTTIGFLTLSERTFRLVLTFLHNIKRLFEALILGLSI